MAVEHSIAYKAGQGRKKLETERQFERNKLKVMNSQDNPLQRTIFSNNNFTADIGGQPILHTVKKEPKKVVEWKEIKKTMQGKPIGDIIDELTKRSLSGSSQLTALPKESFTVKSFAATELQRRSKSLPNLQTEHTGFAAEERRKKSHSLSHSQLKFR